MRIVMRSYEVWEDRITEIGCARKVLAIGEPGRQMYKPPRELSDAERYASVPCR